MGRSPGSDARKGDKEDAHGKSCQRFTPVWVCPENFSSEPKFISSDLESKLCTLLIDAFLKLRGHAHLRLALPGLLRMPGQLLASYLSSCFPESEYLKQISLTFQYLFVCSTSFLKMLSSGPCCVTKSRTLMLECMRYSSEPGRPKCE